MSRYALGPAFFAALERATLERVVHSKRKRPRRCPVVMVTQSVIFPKSYGEKRARAWLRSHGEHAGKVDKTTASLRFRQIPPSSCASFATIKMGSTGIRKIVCCPKR